MPTLLQVAEEKRFEPLRGLILPVKDTPVNELSEELRLLLRKKSKESEDVLLLFASFFAACDIRAGDTGRKRGHVASGDESPGKDCFFSLLALLLSLAFRLALWRVLQNMHVYQ